MKNDLVVEDTIKLERYSLDQITNKVIHGDALEILKKVPDDSVDLVFLDPPYFLQLPKKSLNDGMLIQTLKELMILGINLSPLENMTNSSQLS